VAQLHGSYMMMLLLLMMMMMNSFVYSLPDDGFAEVETCRKGIINDK
jgi:hypothetical protein